MPETASPLEIAYTLGALLGLVAAFFASIEGIRDLRSVGRPPDGGLALIAWGNLGVIFVAVYNLTHYAAIGIYALQLPDAPSPNIGARLLGYGFIGSEVLCVFLMWGIVWGRRRVAALFEQHRKEARRARKPAKPRES